MNTEILDEARMVRVLGQVVHVWYGGHTIKILDVDTLEEIDVYERHPKPEDVEEARADMHVRWAYDVAENPPGDRSAVWEIVHRYTGDEDLAGEAQSWAGEVHA